MTTQATGQLLVMFGFIGWVAVLGGFVTVGLVDIARHRPAAGAAALLLGLFFALVGGYAFMTIPGGA